MAHRSSVQILFQGIAVAAIVIATQFSTQSAQAGYTHYFSWREKPDDKQLKACLDDMARVIDAGTVPLAGPDGLGKPIIEPLNLEFNGRGKEAYETFLFPGKIGFNFCKTQYRPYDAVVTACLLVARDHFPAEVLRISSDGQWEEGDWDAGAALYQQVFRRRALCPFAEIDAPAVEIPGQPEEWSPLGIIVVVGIGVGILWWLIRPHYSFVIFVERSRIDRVRGDAPRPFLMDVDDICRDCEIPRGTIREIRIQRSAMLFFSPGIPRDCRQRIRNTWRVHL